MRLAQQVSRGQERQTPDVADRYSEGWAWVRVRGAFFPDVIEARPGERLRLVFRREETAACSEWVVVPSLGKSVMLPPFEDVPVDLGPLPPGEHEFSCKLGVLRGRILVRGQVVHPPSVEGTEPTAVSAPCSGAIGGLVLLGSAGGTLVAVLEVLLILAGSTSSSGALGHSPLYRKLGYTPP